MDGHVARGDLFAAESLLDEVAKKFAKTPHAARIAERREKLVSREDFEKKRDAWRVFHAAADAARTGKKAAVATAKRKLHALAEEGDAALAAAARDLLAVLEKPWTLEDSASFGGMCGGG